MANVGTSSVAYATQQSAGQLVFIASDGTACVLFCDGTNQKFAYAAPPYSSWTTTTLVTGLNMSLAGAFRAGSDNIDVVTGTSSNVRPTYYPLTKSGSTWTLGATTQISTTASGTSGVGNVMSYCGADPQGRHWIVCGGASTYTTSRALYSPANNPGGTWTSSVSTTQTGDVNQPAGDQIGNYILKTYWNGTAIQYHRADNSGGSIGAWSTAATISNLGGSPNASSRMLFLAVSSTKGLLTYSTGSGIYAQVYAPLTDTWSAATQLSSNANDRHPCIATDGAGNAWVFWCSYVAANNYALVYKKYDGANWDSSPTTLVASGTNIANPSAGFGNNSIGVTYTQGTANPYTIGWATISIPVTRTRTIAASAALFTTLTSNIIATSALLQTATRAVTASSALFASSSRSVTSSVALSTTAALTVYYSSIASTTLASANQMWVVHGTDNTNVTQFCTQIGTATGYGEVYAQGTAAAWGGGGSAPAPSGNGFLLENSILSLEGQTILAGAWSANVRFGAAQGTCSGLAGSFTADIHVRIYKRSSGGVYTSIIDMVVSAQTINATLTTYSLSGTTVAGTGFTTGDKLYIDILLNITANANPSTQLVRLNRESTDSTNHQGDSNAQVVTPGYSPTGGGGSRTISASVALAAVRTVSVSVALLQPATRNIASSSALAATGTRPVTASVSLFATNTRSFIASSALFQTNTRVVSCAAAFQQTRTRAISSAVALSLVTSRTVTADVSLSGATRAIPCTTALSSTGNRSAVTSTALQATPQRAVICSTAALFTGQRIVNSSGALAASFTRPVSAATALLGTTSRTTLASVALTGAARLIPCSVSLALGNNRFIPAQGAFLQVGTRATLATTALFVPAARSILCSVAVTRQSDRAIIGSSALLQVSTRETQASLALLETRARVASDTVALTAVQARILPCSVSLTGGVLRSVSCSVSLLQYNTHVIITTVALVEGIAYVPLSTRSGGATLFVRSGQTQHVVRSGQTRLFTRKE